MLVRDHISQPSLHIALFIESAGLEKTSFNPGKIVGLRMIYGSQKVHR